MIRIAASIIPIASVLLAFSMAQGQELHGIHEKAGVACSTCHKEAPAEVAPPSAICEACHGTMTGDDDPIVFPDPHRSPHLGPNETPVCSDCHNIHRKSEVTCVTCHRGFEFQIK